MGGTTRRELCDEAAMEETPEQSAEEEIEGATNQLVEEEPSIDEKTADESAGE